jgi:hypothetical protein
MDWYLGTMSGLLVGAAAALAMKRGSRCAFWPWCSASPPPV